MNTMIDTIRNLWENAVVRYSIILGSLFACPMVFLTLAKISLNATVGG